MTPPDILPSVPGKGAGFHMRGGFSGVGVLFAALTVFFLLIMAAPLASLFAKAFLSQDGAFVGLANYAKYFATPALSVSIIHTLEVSLIVAGCASILGFLYAYALTRTRIIFKRAFMYLALLPVFMPTVVHALGLVYLFGTQGVITQTGIDIGLYGRTGIIMAEIIYTFPQAFLMFYVSLSYADGRLYEVADAMGVTPVRKLWGITLPNVRYTAVSVAFVCFTLCFTDFGVPKVIGGSYSMVAMDVYKQVAGQFNMNMGAVVGSILLAPALLSYIVDRFVARKEGGEISAKATALRVPESRGRDAVFFAFCLLVAICFIALVAALVMGAFSDYYPYKMGFTTRHFSFDRSTGGIQSFTNSILMSFLTAVIGTAFVFIYAWLIEKTRGFTAMKHLARFLSSLPVALPGMVIGLSFIFFFNTKGNPMNAIYGTVWILVLAGVLHFYSVPYITASSALKKLDKEFENVAESLRVPARRSILSVSVPLCLPAILEIFIYYFVYSMCTVSAVVFLYSADFKVAAIAITHMEEAGNYAQAAAMSLLILLVNIGIRVAYEIVTGRLRKQSEARSRAAE
ncbi:MAG: putative 2-aminoethylphosphonate ABC transporter permease subunit [Clostridiales bacterium]|nr:putative 2-aminoethylphosphonate ABC transporter permease subunit [Clostridiales bacterium]